MVADQVALAVARHRLTVESEAVAALGDALDDAFTHAASVILRCKGKVFIGGSGTSGTVAKRMAHILSVTGTPSIAFSPMDSLHGASGAIGADDVVLLISKGGASTEVLDSARVAQRRGALVVALTGSNENPLARVADHNVAVDARSDADIGGVVATGITLVQAAWGDALAEVLMRARGYTWAEFMSTHPAGAVGQRDDLPEDLPSLEIPRVEGAEIHD